MNKNNSANKTGLNILFCFFLLTLPQVFKIVNQGMFSQLVGIGFMSVSYYFYQHYKLPFIFLIYFLISGKLSLLASVLVVIGIKIIIDLVFHSWSVYLYKRWTNDSAQPKFSLAIAAAILEPFTFQLLRHLGAAMGWYYFLVGRKTWGKQVRHPMQ